jgi:anti-sigma regulatory factor (Ser/Thr protein kinase)
MEVTERHVFALDDGSRPGEVRRAAAMLAGRVGADVSEAGRIALIATEATTNAVKHAREGEAVLYGSRRDDAWSVGVVTFDRGPGMRDVAACLRDGVSTSGSPGTGLGAIRRLASTFDVHSTAAGTVVLAEVRGGKPAQRGGFDVGMIRVPHPGEQVCGDDGVVVATGEGRCVVLLVDGLGHGLPAATAAEEATRLCRAHPDGGPEAVLAMLHDGLRGTRGAAAAVAEVDPRHGLVRYAGVGNVEGAVHAAGTTKRMVSHHGTLGHQATRIHGFTYPWSARAMLVLHSDGLSTRSDLEAYPGLAERHPMLVAAVLYRDFGRRTDDASVVVLREAMAA